MAKNVVFGWGRMIREARDLKGWSQERLAVEMSVRGATVSRWETMATKPGIDVANRLVSVLDIPAGPFLRELGFERVSSSLEAQIYPPLLAALRQLPLSVQKELTPFVQREAEKVRLLDELGQR